MTSNTQSIEIRTEAQDVLHFVANPENLPRWATGFCESIQRDGDGWSVKTPQGEVGLKIVSHAESGVVDFHMSPAPGVCAIASSRVVPSPVGAVYVFTQSQAPEMPDEAFQAQVDTLGEELKVLKNLLETAAD